MTSNKPLPKAPICDLDGTFCNIFIVKKESYEQFIQGRYNVFFVLDARDPVVKMQRSQGLTCLQVAEENF